MSRRVLRRPSQRLSSRVNTGSVVEPERIVGIIEALRRFAIPVLVWETVREFLVNDLRMVPPGSRC